MSAGARFCPNCGAANEPPSPFCPNCGAKLGPGAGGSGEGGAAPTQILTPAAPSPTVRLGDRGDGAAHAPTQILAAAPPAAEQRPSGRRLQWALVGAAGCLGVIMLAACAGLALLTLRNLSPAAAPAAVTALPAPAGPTAAAGAGGIIPADSPLTGAEVLLDEGFDDPGASGFLADEDESSRYTFEEGGYTIEVRETELVVWTLAPGRFGDLAASVDAVFPEEGALAAAGLIFHYQDDANFYLFQVSSDGYYTLELLADDEWIILIDWTESAAIDGAENSLRVETRGDRIALYVNGALLEETRDDTFTRGEVGLAASSFEEPGAAVRFDNLLIERN